MLLLWAPVGRGKGQRWSIWALLLAAENLERADAVLAYGLGLLARAKVRASKGAVWVRVFIGTWKCFNRPVYGRRGKERARVHMWVCDGGVRACVRGLRGLHVTEWGEYVRVLDR